MVLYIAPIANIAVRCLPRLALACDPQLFLFDEPMSNLDAKLRVEMRAEIKRLHHVSGITRVYVPHDQIEAMTLGSRIAVMKDGVL